MFKRLWNLLFDDRYVEVRRFRPFHIWFAWTPVIGGNLDFNIQFIPSHKARFADEEDDLSWGPELRLSADLLWVSFGLTIPNEDHPANEIVPTKRYCGCGREATTRFKLACEGCHNVPDLCTCAAPDDMLMEIPDAPHRPVVRCSVCYGCASCDDAGCCVDCEWSIFTVATKVGWVCNCEGHECLKASAARCFACESCPECTRDCCSGCINEIGEAGDLIYCNCVGHECVEDADADV